MNPFASALRLLQDRDAFVNEIHEQRQLNQKITSLLFSSFFFFALYGAIIGSFHSLPQAVSSAIKLPTLYLITLLISLPTLYIFNVLFGSRQSLGQHFTFVLAAASVISVLLCGFAPITFFFLTTATAKDYHFFLLLNVAIFSLTGIMGVSFLYNVMRPTDEVNEEKPWHLGNPNDRPQSPTATGSETGSDSSPATVSPAALPALSAALSAKGGGAKTRRQVLQLWLCLYGFVGSQLGWTLRPFFGSPGNFEMFRPREGNFISGVWNATLSFFN
jgi:hypothetical protein